MLTPMPDFSERIGDTSPVRRDRSEPPPPSPPLTPQRRASNIRITVGILRTLAVMVEQLGPEHVSVDVQVDPLCPDRKRFVLEVEAGEFERVSSRLGVGFGGAVAPPRSSP